MPNWCHNQLNVSGPVEDVQRFKEKAVGHSPWLSAAEVCREKPDPLNFDSLFPVPEELVKQGYNEAAYQWERSNWEWSGLTFDLEYEECGIGFKGMTKAHGGQLDDHCVSL